MNTKIFDFLPRDLKQQLLEIFNSIIRNYVQQKWEPSELDGGKLCEVVYTILKGNAEGKIPDKPQKPVNFYDACKEFEKLDQSKFNRSLRIHLPRMLIALYEVRNNRGVSHTGGDVDPNHMDAVLVVDMAKWILAELVREFHKLAPDEATNVVEEIIERIVPIIWEVNGKQRILDRKLNFTEKMLVILYKAGVKEVSSTDLYNWVEYSVYDKFEKNILIKAHKERLIEFDKQKKLVWISPYGAATIEKKIQGGI
ncbi:MAG: hypothetical protein WC442_00420 [Candidatus Omnitrophota bacterium]